MKTVVGTALTSAWPVISSAHFCHCGHLSRSSKVVSLDVQQHCSWLYQKADRHTPSFRSVIQSTARSITPASVPADDRTRQAAMTESRPEQDCFTWFQTTETYKSTLQHRLTVSEDQTSQRESVEYN